jgi:hypothetical protein
VKRLVAVLSLVLAAAVLPAGGPAAAQHAPSARYDWFEPTDYRQVLFYETEPSAHDLHLHFKFKRYGGKGLREVRIRERAGNPVQSWYTHPAVRLEKGEKAVFTTEAAMACAPALQPVQYDMQMRIRLPGKPWSPWLGYIGGANRILDCTENP